MDQKRSILALVIDSDAVPLQSTPRRVCEQIDVCGDTVHALLISTQSLHDNGSGDGHCGPCPVPNVTCLCVSPGMGLGQVQKIGLHTALDQGHDLVIVCRASQRLTTDVLQRIVEKCQETDADVVLTQPVVPTPTPASSASTRFLAWCHRCLTGIDCHSASHEYRAYTARFLRSVPFEINTDGDSFDLELLLQAHYIGGRVVTMDMPSLGTAPTPRSWINSLSQVMGEIAVEFQYRCHCSGMLCSLKYRDLSPLKYRDKTTHLYSSHTMALDIVRKLHPRTILDIGCGAGFVAKCCESMGAQVTGLDQHRPLPNMMSDFKVADLEAGSLPLSPTAFDLILMLDIVEHLAEPERFLLAMREETGTASPASPAPAVIISTPNVAFVTVRLGLLVGRFNYAERGILDIAHKRLFTKGSLLRMLRDCGYAVETVRPVGVPFESVIGGRLGRMLGRICQLAAWLWSDLFAFQFLVTCRPLPSARHILQVAQRNGCGGGT